MTKKKPISIASMRKAKRKSEPVVTVQWDYDPHPLAPDLAAWCELWDTLYALCYPLCADEHVA